MNDPGSGERRDASRCAAVRCSSSLKRWKKDAVWITDTCPWRGVSDPPSACRSGRGVPGADVKGACGAMCFSSKTFPWTKGSG